eukprot:gene3065-biopygen25866
MPKLKAKKHGGKLCSVDGCTTNAKARGVCKKHGANGTYCPNKVVARRVCAKHGANGFCSFGNCKTAARNKGRCSRHGGGSTKVCKVKDCDTLAKARGLCRKHGASGTCTTKGCTTSAITGFKHCFKHGGRKNTPCSVAGCTTPSKRKGLCAKHGGGPGRCYAGNCTNVIVGMWMTCGKHGGHGECSHPSGCRHGGKLCSVDGCTAKAKARGVCFVHGANGKCKTINCSTNAEKLGGYCARHGGKAGYCQAIPPCNTPAIPGKFVCTMHGAHGICSAWGCTKNANQSGRGVCRAHDIKVLLCSTPDCPNKVVARRVCTKHGANGFCSFGNCKTAAHSKGRCKRHGGGRSKECKVKYCDTLAQARGLCSKHGAHGTCTTKGCTTSAIAGFKHCCKHGGGKKTPCSVAGCTTNSVRKGLCAKHGGGAGQCYAGNCTKQIVGMWMTCAEHGGHGECAHPSGCRYPVLKRTKKDGRGFCQKHADA